jgi:hypothetical protein
MSEEDIIKELQQASLYDDIVIHLRRWAKSLDDSDMPILRTAADAIEIRDAEIERLRSAIEALLFDIDEDHQPEWASDEAKAAGKKPWCCRWCGPQDGSWPCSHRMALDTLKEIYYE